MNGPFVVAQAGSNANSGSAPVQIIKLTKPEAGHTEIFHASFNGTVKIDFTAIANEKITLFHDSKTQSLHVIFADGSQDIIEPFFDSRGTILGNLLLEMGPNVVYGGEQFAQTFTISEDPSVLPAAGPGGVAAGADFHGPAVDPFGLSNPLDLLPPEVFPGITFTGTEAPAFTEAFTEETNLFPTVSGHVLGIVEEEALNAQVIEQPSDSGQGNEDIHDASGNDHDTSATGPGSQITTQAFSGTLAGLVSGGNLPITFLTNVGANGTDVHDSNGNVVTSIGLAVHYDRVSDTEIDGRTSDGRLIFTLTIGADGAFTFTLNDQIDHPTHSHDDGTHPQGIFEETLNIDLSTAVVAHDATPDPVVFPTNTFDIGVIDDTPIVSVEANENFSVTHDETLGLQTAPFGDDNDILFTPVFNGVSNPGHDPDGIFGLPLGYARSTGSALQIDSVGFGADGPSVSNSQVYSLTLTDSGGNPASGPVDSGIKTTAGNEIFLFVENGLIVGRYDGNDAGTDVTNTGTDPAAFAIAIDPADGQVSVVQYVSLFHNSPDVGVDSDEFVSLADAAGSVKATLTVTDGDGDVVSASADISGGVRFEDDGPTVHVIAKPAFGLTADESPGNQADDVTGPLTVFDNVTNKGDDPGEPGPTLAFATSSTGSLAILPIVSSFGVDGPSATNSVVYSLTLGGADGLPSGLKVTDGNTISLYSETDGTNSWIVGRVDGGTFAGEAAFAIAIDPTTGVVSIADYLSLFHADPNNPNDTDTLNSHTILANVTLTDGDGDTASGSADISGKIHIRDDGPTALSALVSVEVYEDGLPTGNPEGPPGSQPTVVTITSADLNSFVNIGADDPATFSYNSAKNGTLTGLSSDSSAISYQISGDTVSGVTADSRTIFTIVDNHDGTYTFTLLGAVDHLPLNSGGGDAETLTLNIASLFTATDGDGDHVNLTGQLNVVIENDIPVITNPTNLIVNGSFEEGHTNLSGTDWDIYSSLPGWTEGADHIPFEVQTGGVGDIAAEDGVALIELDGDRTGNPAHQPPSATPDPFNTDATIQQVISGTQAGVDYELTFWYTPRPGHSGGDDDGLNVLWNGNVIDSIDSSGLPEGVWQQITLFVTGTGPGDTLGFQGEGDRDEFGALIDNVSLIQAVIVDEDGLPSGNHDSQPGDIVVPNTDGDNNEATSTGQLNIKWGADNFDAATDTHVGGNPALGFVQDLGGRSVTFTDTTVGITGGTLTSHGDAITITLSADNTVLTGTAQHGADPVRTVFEVSLSDDNTGAFRFILQDALDHATGNNENNIMLTFDFTATDSDGDPALGHFQVLVNDDLPVAVNDVDSVAGAGQVATGNVITGIDLFNFDANTTDGNADHVGADGPGKITQLVGFGTTLVTAHNFQVLGQFGTLVLTENGDYIYTRTSSSDGTDHFTYTLSDHDGDTSVANLDIFVSPVAHNDAVITNIASSGAAIGIPDLALLLNDIDISGPSVLSVGAANSGTIGHDALTTTTTFTDDNLDGGSFNYTIGDNGTLSTAHVTVDRQQAGHSELDGTSASEILIGTTSADTLVGNGGSDILVGNGGANHFLYNATTDGGTIANQAGADHILDFNTALGDSIDVSASAFGGALIAGNDASGIFGSSANDNFGSPTERFHFNTSTHTLLYDSNGSVAGGTQVALAVLEHAATVDATHIHAVA